jgi:hypothetical protein
MMRGIFEAAQVLLVTAEIGPLGELAAAQVQRMRAQVAFALRRGGAAPPLLLRAALEGPGSTTGALERGQVLSLGWPCREYLWPLGRLTVCAYRPRPKAYSLLLLVGGAPATTQVAPQYPEPQ